MIQKDAKIMKAGTHKQAKNKRLKSLKTMRLLLPKQYWQAIEIILLMVQVSIFQVSL